MARGESDAAVIGISAAVTYDVISATNSSPQTTELNAAARAPTLMKWVHMGLAQAALFIVLMTLAEPKGLKWRPATGGGIAGVLLYAQYVHARNSGLSNGGTPTETYAATTPGQAYDPTAGDPNYQPPFVGSTQPQNSRVKTRHYRTRVKLLK